MKAHQRKTITEGTRWLVGIEQPNGKILSTYGHYDGYPEWAGKHLKKYYNNPAKAKELLKLGRSGISSIGKKIKGSKNHSFDNPEKDVAKTNALFEGPSERRTNGAVRKSTLTQATRRNILRKP